RRRRSQGGGCGGPYTPFLELHAQQRPGGDWQDDPTRSGHRHRGRRPRAVAALSGRDADPRERGDQPASPRSDDGDRPLPPDDRAVRPPGTGRHARGGADGADRPACGDHARTLRGVRQAGAVVGLMLADPLVTAVARYASRFSIRALDATVDHSVLLVGAGLAMAAAVLLAYVPRLPSSTATAGFRLASGSARITPGTNRRLRMFATTH